MLPEFELLMPRTLAEALSVLAKHAPDAAPVAGATNLIPDMCSGRRRPRYVVNIASLPELQGIRQEDWHLVIGAAVTVAEVLDDPLVARFAPVLREAAAVLASPLVRNRATVVGNLTNASPAADMAPPLLVLDAEVEIAGREGVRRVALKDFFLTMGRTACRPHELVTAVRVLIPAPGSAATFCKIGLRNADAIAIVNGAVRVDWDGDGRCRTARVALGAVAPTPIRAFEAECVLEGERLTPEVIAEAACRAAEATRPIDDLRGSAAYRRHVAAVIVRRMVERLE